MVILDTALCNPTLHPSSLYAVTPARSEPSQAKQDRLTSLHVSVFQKVRDL